MKLTLLCSVLLLQATAAHAVIVVQIEQRIVGPRDTVQHVPLEVYLDPGPLDPDNERLASFHLKVDLLGGRPDGFQFILPPGPTSPSHPPAFPGVELVDLGSDYDTIFVSASLPPGQGVDVTYERNGLFTAVVEVPANFEPRVGHPMVVDELETGFFDSSGAPVLWARGLSGGVFTIPEPAALSLLAPAALLALRRRRERKKGTFTISRIM